MAGNAQAQSMFNHSISIKIPKGANGMQPELTLVYDPGGGNGMVGMGWNLTGLSAISRINYGGGINYNGAATYAHTQIGVLIPQADGTYRSKKESFTKVVPTGGTCGDAPAPCSWVAYDRSGTQFYYGTTADSRLVKQGTASVRVWGLAKVVDLFGNSYEVEYLNDAINGQIYPSRITYTKGLGLATYRTVQFGYDETRTDTEPGYYQNTFEQTTRRLQWIYIYSDGLLLRQYRLDYAPSYTTGRSLLIAVQEYGKLGLGALPAQRFGWQQGSGGYVGWGFYNPPVALAGVDLVSGLSFNTGVRLVDLNGDGLPDLVQGFYSYGTSTRSAWVNTPHGWTQSVAYAPPADFAGRDGGAPAGWDSGLRLIDINGDGLPDLVQGWYNYGTLYRAAWLNNGGNCSTSGCAWTPAPNYAPPTAFSGRDSGAPGGWDYGLQLADLNGDGKVDLLKGQSYFGAPILTAWLNTGTGWAEHGAFAPPTAFTAKDAGTPGGWDTGLRIVDVNGDGLPDLLQGLSSYGVSYRNAWINNGNGWTSSSAFAPPGDFSGRDASALGGWDGGLRVADLNGDGKPDLIQGWSHNGALTRGAWINTGSGWLSSPGFAPPADFAGRDSATPRGWDCGLQVTDLNGDGKADLMQGWANYGTRYKNAWVNNGVGWIATSAYAPAQFFSLRDSTNPGGYDMGLRLVDLDGDGRPDILYANSLSAQARAAWTIPAPGQPDLMTSVQNGLGATVTVTYLPAPQVFGAIAANPAKVGMSNTAPQPLVTKVSTDDGRGGMYETDYFYYDVRLYPGTIPNQRNLGFAWVQAEDRQTTQSTVTYYNQVPGYEGHVSQVDVTINNATGDPFVVTRKTVSYELVYPSVGTELVREVRSNVYAYEPYDQTAGVLTQTTTTTYADYGNPTPAYADYGNPTVKTQYADALPTVTVTTTYANDTANWILGRITEVKTTSGGRTLGDTVNTWTGNTITEKKNWLDTANTWITTTMTYYDNGNIWTVTEPPTGDGITRKTTTEYDQTFKAYPTKITNALNQVTQRDYWEDGLIKSFTDANNNVTSTTYDAFGRKQHEARQDGGTTDYSYLNYGSQVLLQYNRVVITVDKTRSITRDEYFDGTGFVYQVLQTGDDGKTVCVSYAKDAAGRQAFVSTPHYGNAAAVWTTTTYDAVGRVKTVTTPDNQVSSYTYGLRSLAVTDPNKNVTTRYFDARKQVTSVVDAAGQSTSYGYDPLGRVVSVTLPVANYAVTAIAYDSLNRKTSITDPQVGTRDISFTYDALNRVKTKQPAGEPPVAYSYDDSSMSNGIGRLTSVTDSSGTTKVGYAWNGQVSAYVKQIDGGQYSQTSTYDYAGRLIHMTYPEGSYADYMYTDGGNLWKLKLNGADPPIATWSSYTASGKPQTVAYGNLVGTTYGYDAMDHLTSLLATKGTGPQLQNLTYDWYTLPNTSGLNIGSITDNRASKIGADGSNTDETQTYTYDALYRLTKAVGVWGQRDVGAWTTKVYIYDAVGNPTTFGGLVNRTLSFTGQQVTSGTGLSGVTYDVAGNMKHKVLDGVTWEYVWTSENRLASATKNGILAAQMSYDADGQRVKKVYFPSMGPTVTTIYIGNTYEKRTYTNGTPDRHTVYLYGNGHLVMAWTRTGTIATAFNKANGWRTDLAAASLYEGRSVLGAAKKAFLLLCAAAKHPRSVQWLVLGCFALFAAWALAAFLPHLEPSRRARAYARTLRLVGMAVALIFTLNACSGWQAGPYGQATDYVLSGDTTNGPAIGSYYYHGNHINSSSVITDANGVEATRIVYLPFGELSQLNSVGGDTVTAKFTGQEYDEETGLYNLGARYYDPAIGRFVNADSIVPQLTDAQAFNRYSYVKNNPIVYVDPTGHFLDFIGHFFRWVWDGVKLVAHALAEAAEWVGRAAVSVFRFAVRAATFAWGMVTSMVSNPAAMLSFVFAAALSIAALNPGPLLLWGQATAAAVGAQSIAMAAGVRNPTVLGLIGAMAGAVGVGAATMGEFLKTGAGWGANLGLTKLEGDKLGSWLAPLNGLGSAMVVNAVGGETNWVLTKDGPVDPDGKGALSGGNTVSYKGVGVATLSDSAGYEVASDYGVYSGTGEGLNNPDVQCLENRGPIPANSYEIGNPHYSATAGPLTLDLTPDPNAPLGTMCGRTDLAMHSDSYVFHGFTHTQFEASTGCLITSYQFRQVIVDHGFGTLNVSYP